MNRPVGVTVIAVLYFIRAAFDLLVGLATMVLLAGFLRVRGRDGEVLMGVVLAIVAAVNLIVAPVDVVVGRGMLKLKGWARIVSFVFAGLEIFGSMFVLAGGWAHFKAFTIFAGQLNALAGFLLFCRLAVSAWIILYLLHSNVRGAFERGQITAASA